MLITFKLLLFYICSPVSNKFYAIYSKEIKFKAEYPHRDIEEMFYFFGNISENDQSLL